MLFFVLTAIATIGAMVSILEVPVAWIIEKGHMRRRGAAILTGGLMFALGVPATLSQNPLLAEVKPFGKNFFDLFDFLSSNVLLPVGGLAIAVLGGWVLSRKDFAAEMNQGFQGEPWHGRLLYAILKFVTPVLILLILLSSLGVIKL
jgi:NSS family neurotransmitter:Na+ symporter